MCNYCRPMNIPDSFIGKCITVQLLELVVKKKIIKKIKKNSAQGMAKLNTAFQQVIYLSLLSTRNQQCYPLFLSQQIFFIGLTRFT